VDANDFAFGYPGSNSWIFCPLSMAKGSISRWFDQSFTKRASNCLSVFLKSVSIGEFREIRLIQSTIWTRLPLERFPDLRQPFSSFQIVSVEKYLCRLFEWHFANRNYNWPSRFTELIGCRFIHLLVYDPTL
jgi:hypothetical protein